MERISVVGLGKVGLPVAACLASGGYKVIAVDVDRGRVAAVNEGRSPTYEPGLSELLQECVDSLRATTDYDYAVNESDVTFTLVPTPSDDTGSFSTRFVEDAVRSIAHVLRSKNASHWEL